VGDSPSVSILIPAYNREREIVRALDSAITQTYSNLEIIVVDNASTDNTFAVAQAYAARDARVKCFRNATNLGPVPNWLKCVEFSTGEYVKILFSDDWLEPDAIAEYLNPILANQEIGLVYSSADIHLVDRTLQAAYHLDHSHVARLEFLNGFITGEPNVPLSPSCAFFRKRDVVKALVAQLPIASNTRCDELGIGQDLLLFLRMCDSYKKFFHISRPLVHFGGGKTSLSVRLLQSEPTFLDRCYLRAFVHYLQTSHLSGEELTFLYRMLFVARAFADWCDFLPAPEREHFYKPVTHYVFSDLRTFVRRLIPFAPNETRDMIRRYTAREYTLQVFALENRGETTPIPLLFLCAFLNSPLTIKNQALVSITAKAMWLNFRRTMGRLVT
jgi:glycosyltransferase involved in cell wall biosynthesis